MIDTAIEIATICHRNQKDLGGEFYILHPIRLMMKMQTNEEKIVAILHDVIEDSEMNISFIRAAGFSEDVIEALEYLTKRKGELYGNYIKRLSKNKIAKKVKVADLEDNMNIKRLSKLTDNSYKRFKKYHQAWSYLNSN